MAIQIRRGIYNNFDPTKLKPGEFAVVQSGDSSTSSGIALYICISSGRVLRIVSEDEIAGITELASRINRGLIERIEEALDTIDDLQSVEERITEAVNDYIDDHPDIWNVSDGSISTAKLADGAVTVDKLASGVLADNLTTANAGVAALDARQGRLLNENKVDKTSIADDLTTNDATKVLSAKQGKILQDNKVDMTTPLINLDVNAAASTVDGQLTAALTALGWLNDVIES